jgi:hypothetical protein
MNFTIKIFLIGDYVLVLASPTGFDINVEEW